MNFPEKSLDEALKVSLFWANFPAMGMFLKIGFLQKSVHEFFFIQVSFQTQSQNTRVIKETLCPEWDQTLVFEGVQLYGSPKSFAENPPYVVCEAFDKDKVVSMVVFRPFFGAHCVP